MEWPCVYRAPRRATVFPERGVTLPLFCLSSLREPPLRRWCHTCRVYYTGDLIQHRRTQDHKVRATRCHGPGRAVSRPRAGREGVQAGTESPCQSVSAWPSRKCGFSTPQRVSSLGFSFPICPARARHHLALPLSRGARGAPPSACAVSCLLSVAICHPISEPVAQGRDVLARALAQGLRLQMWWPAGGRRGLAGAAKLRLGTLPAIPLVCPPSPQIAKQSLRPFCTVCNRYFRTPRKFVEHVKSQGHKDKAKEVTPAPSGDIGSGRCRVLAKATQQVEIYPSPNS